MSQPPVPAPVAPRRRAVLGLGLLVLAAVAGTALVLTLDHPPTETGRPELTARDHALLAPRLADVDAGIDRIVAEAATLATAGREVLTRSRALDTDAADAAIATGSQASAAIAGLREDLIKRREVMTAGVDLARVRDSDRTRIATVDRALLGVTQLPVAWVAVVGAAADSLDLVRSIQAHDAKVADATAAARADDLPGALAALSDARRLLVPAHAVRRSAEEAGADVSTLVDLLARLDAYDAALERLYTLLVASNGAVTDGIRAAYAQVEAAQASLPLDDDALRVIVSDLAGPAITAALVDIEAHRGLLADAVAARPDTVGG